MDKSLEDLLAAYSKGIRHFKDWEFNEDISAKGLDLRDVYFEGCYMFFDFRETILTNSKFIECHIKCVDFRNSDLANAIIKNCATEEARFYGANTTNLIFEENYSHGNIVNQDDFERIFKASEEIYSTIVIGNGKEVRIKNNTN